MRAVGFSSFRVEIGEDGTLVVVVGDSKLSTTTDTPVEADGEIVPQRSTCPPRACRTCTGK